jgi:hypothetical protein
MVPSAVLWGSSVKFSHTTWKELELKTMGYYFLTASRHSALLSTEIESGTSIGD